MKELSPLTISNSVLQAPTVLLTSDLRTYRFIQPITPAFVLAYNIYACINRHFKIEMLDTGTFSLKGVKFFCAETPPGKIAFSDWLDYLWSTKSKSRNILNPEVLFRILLLELFFPIFKFHIYLLLDKKDRFVVDAYPIIGEQGMVFTPLGFDALSLHHPSIVKLFRYQKEELLKHIEEFEVLDNDKLFIDLKYQASMYPEIRNHYWEEIKKCFDTDYKKQNYQHIRQYIMGL